MVFHHVVRVDEPYVVTDSVLESKKSVLRLIQQIRAMTGVAPAHHRHTLSIALWKWTEAGGVAPHPKYNIRYVSRGVVEASRPVKINHEHVHTRSSMVKALLAGRLTDAEALEYLQSRGEACVVTVDEHAQLGTSTRMGWARYVDVGIDVFDRKQQQYVDPMSITGGLDPAPREAPAASRGGHPTNSDVEQNIHAYSSPKLRPLLLRLAEATHLAAAVPMPQATSHKPSYFRIHDAELEEPTRAAAYANFNGNLDLALDLDDVPRVWRDSAHERSQNQKPYLVRWKVHDEESLEIGTELLALALEKIRGEGDT